MKILKNLSVMLVAFFILSYSLPIFATTDITFDQKIGMNGFVDCKRENLTAGRVLREYHNFGWTYDANSGKCYFKSSWFDFDEFYKSVYDSGITILPCIQQGNNTESRENKPVSNGDDTLNPTSYKIHSNVLFNYVARYGSNTVDESKLNLTDGTEAKTGLGYIKYYENWNEPDKTWLGPNACFSPEEFAAMCSADYDGHEGALGEVYGIKQADPNAKLVYGGLAGGSAGVDYLNRMKAWSEENRPSKTLPFDAINFHMYCGTNSPEASNFVTNATLLIDWKNENAPDKEVWLTEFGWDTNTASPRSAPSFDTQRDWIVREYLIGDRIGLDRMTVYNGRDDGSPETTTQYATCGLTTQKGSEERKSSWYGVNTLRATLEGFKFVKVIREDSIAYIYKYKNETTNELCYALWSPTQDGSKVDDYKLTIENIDKATLIQLKDKEELGVSTPLDIDNNAIKLNVSESPIFVKVTLKNTNTNSEEPENNSQNNTQEPANQTQEANYQNTNSAQAQTNTNTQNTNTAKTATQESSRVLTNNYDSTKSSTRIPNAGIDIKIVITIIICMICFIKAIISFVLYKK